MATMIPDRLPGRASKGEERVFDLLKRLPDSYIVYYEPIVENRYPDFIIIAPDLGVMVIEVKGWYPKDIEAADNNLVSVKEGNRLVRRVHPVRQARDYMLSLMDRSREIGRSQLLIHPDGKMQGRFKFPFGHLAVLSNITSEQITERGFGQVFTDSKVVYRDLLLQWEESRPSGQELIDTLKGYFDPFWEIDPMTDEMVAVLRAIIHPEIIIQRLPYEDGSDTNQPDLKVLDKEQEEAARKIGAGHRLIFGVPGSGKTVLLIARAKILATPARERPEYKVLVLCFNVSLASYLKRCLADYPNVHVKHFDGFSRGNGVTRGRDENGKTEGNESLGARLLEGLESGNAPCSNTYDAVLIDEGQDFSPNWFKCVLAAMKDPNDGDLLIVGDGNQGLYERERISWKSLGISASGRRTSYLVKNYRNTREIIECAKHFAEGADDLEVEPDHIIRPMIDPDQCLRRGIKPRLFQGESLASEQQVILAGVKGLLDGNFFGQAIDPVKPHDIGILYPNCPRDHRQTMNDLKESLKDLAPVLWLNDPNNSQRERVDFPGIRIQTIHGSKGLQCKAIILMFSDLLPIDWGEVDHARDYRLFYVGLTRPEDYLLITSSNPTEMLSRFSSSDAVINV